MPVAASIPAGRPEVEDMAVITDPALFGGERRPFAITDVHRP